MILLNEDGIRPEQLHDLQGSVLKTRREMELSMDDWIEKGLPAKILAESREGMAKKPGRSKENQS